MNKTVIRYFEAEDILHIAIADGPESRSIELGPTITVELNDNDEMIGVEILEASSFLRDAVLESIQARTLRVLEAAGG
ncbi:MAG: DNA polymerase III subunit alpha [Anaerolineae bacterium]|nr:MAG: DNA polymerase III subunit alpha [Anaerolineae bacterium]